MKTISLCIFPRYSRSDPTHYHYWLKLFDSVDQTRVMFLFESGKPSDKAFLHAYTQKISTKPFNLIERALLIINAYRKGVRHLHIHYSCWTAIVAILIKKLLPITISYWHCERYDKKPRDVMLAYILASVDMLVTGSKEIADQYKKHYPKIKSTNIIPNFVEPIDVKPASLDPKHTHILFAHRLVARKGSEVLPHIVRELLKKPMRHMHIVGSGPDEVHLKKELHDIRSKITWYGRISPKKLASLFRAVDLFIMPSISEGFPRVILETMQYQAPFVATDVGNVPQLVGKVQQQFLVPVGDIEKFSQVCNQLLRKKDLKPLIAENLAKVNTHYRLKHARQAFEKFIDSL